MSKPQTSGSSSDATTPIGRGMTGLSVVVFIVVLEMIPQLLSGRSHLGTRLGFWLFETSLVVAALSAHHHWATRRRVSAARMLLVSLGIAGTVGAVGGLVFLFVAAKKLNIPAPPSLSSLRSVIAFGVVLGLGQCGVWALGFIYPFAMEDARLRALESDKLRLEAEKLKLEADQLRGTAELSRLRSQLQPHFLLNTLNAISGLVTQEPREARRLVGCLGDLLRDSLRDGDDIQTVDEEIKWLRRYAEILESRHAGALRFRWDIADDARAALLPRLLLQPLLENAVNHGALHRPEGGGEVVVRAFIETATADESASSVVCTIEDNGPGFTREEPRPGAFGIRSVQRRLDLEYDGASFALESSAAGTCCTVRVPRVVGRNGASLAASEGAA